MPTPSTSELPKPKSWDEFEEIVWEIYTRRWQDPYAQRYGRSGQAQKGVDIYGQQNSSGKYIAVQCKRYEINLETIVSEVAKAEEFSSSISDYIIVTTTSRDTKIQDSVRQLNEKRATENKFSVRVIFWEDISSYLAAPDNFDLLRKHYPTWGEIFVGRQSSEELFQKESESFDAQIPQATLAVTYWRITFSPQTYNAQLLASRSECDELIKRTTVKIQGWSYPRIPGTPTKGSNWIGVQTELIRHECWRLYQSGHFINISRTWEEDLNNIITDGEIT